MENNEEKLKRKRRNRKFSTEPFKVCYEFAQSLNQFGAGNKVRRVSLFDHLKRSPDSSTSQKLITNSGKYGLIKGSYIAEFLELTPKGKLATSESTPALEKRKIQIELSIQNQEIYNQLYENFKGNKLPSIQVMIDFVKEHLDDIENDEAKKIVTTFLKNCEYLKIAQTISGAERLVNIDHALENIPKNEIVPTADTNELVHVGNSNNIDTFENIEDICFYITPIGEENSEQRKHADLFLESIVIPALSDKKIRVIRADKIAKPGTITKQIIENIFRAKLVIADLSYHNPNVFYELALRHASRLPTVQLIRKADKVPFDLSNYRTITIDTTDIYTLVPKLETYKNEISTQVDEVLNDPDSVDNPVINVFPNFKMKI